MGAAHLCAEWQVKVFSRAFDRNSSDSTDTANASLRLWLVFVSHRHKIQPNTLFPNTNNTKFKHFCVSFVSRLLCQCCVAFFCGIYQLNRLLLLLLLSLLFVCSRRVLSVHDTHNRDFFHARRPMYATVI